MATPRFDVPAASQDWHAQANCRDADIELFFSVDDGDQREALELCASCPVQQPCLTYAIDNREVYGVWGGTREAERRSLIREHRRGSRRYHAA